MPDQPARLECVVISPTSPLVLTLAGHPPVVLKPDGEGGFRGVTERRRLDPRDERVMIAIIGHAE